ncbi:hypothetical protein GCM10008938_50650 [Deinococcus roseus]|uniref:Transposase DDE domain-containing protein n=1 Tax=Deinococcus roseus TaxID=392414 RepID=A0ABQ2DK85_9DEIO|nr:hypothetical protein GCM10008938_50650 [Deinococcus roseus]
MAVLGACRVLQAARLRVRRLRAVGLKWNLGMVFLCRGLPSLPAGQPWADRAWGSRHRCGEGTT